MVAGGGGNVGMGSWTPAQVPMHLKLLSSQPPKHIIMVGSSPLSAQSVVHAITPSPQAPRHAPKDCWLSTLAIPTSNGNSKASTATHELPRAPILFLYINYNSFLF